MSETHFSTHDGDSVAQRGPQPGVYLPNTGYRCFTSVVACALDSEVDQVDKYLLTTGSRTQSKRPDIVALDKGYRLYGL